MAVKGKTLRLLDGVTPHLMITDPPYGVDYDPDWRNRAGASETKRTGKVLNDDRADWREAWALFPGDVAYVWHGALHAGTVAESLAACGFEVRAQIVWAKERLVMSRGHYHWQHEPCWYAVRGKGHWSGGRKQTTLWSIPSRDQDAETVHGTQKPVECMRRPIANNSAEGDAVYEPFSGSGTTIIAGEIEARRVYAMELSPAYVDVAVMRWQDFTGKTAVLLDDDRIFDEVRFVDFYRYVDVDLAELYDFLEHRAPWVRPADTGRSTNCLVNVAGIKVHTTERGYHNYAEPYS